SLEVSDKVKKMMRMSVRMEAQILQAIDFLERTLPYYLSQPNPGPFKKLYGNWTLVVEFARQAERFCLADILFTPPHDFDEADNLDAITEAPTNAELVLRANGLLKGLSPPRGEAQELHHVLV